MQAEFRNYFEPSTTRIPFESQRGSTTTSTLNVLNAQTPLVIACLVQAALLSLLPARLALAPAVLYLVYRALNTTLQIHNLVPNERAQGVVHGKFSAQLPSAKTGSYGSTPAAESLVVFMLGVRFNHPLGVLAPGVKEIGERFSGMTADLSAHAERYGLLGQSSFQGDDGLLMTLFYFRDIDRVRAFAHDPLHRDAWTWFSRAECNAHIGIMHEAYVVPAGNYETIYQEMPPVMLAGAVVKSDTPHGGRWLSPVVDASRGKLRSHLGRLGRE